MRKVAADRSSRGARAGPPPARSVGGVTRLTGSGLSIVEWAPIVGTVPPLNEADWSAAFEKYKQYPQYRITHPDMSLAEFKGIFFWEYMHRLLGRGIGLVFVLPFLWFWSRGCLSPRLRWRLSRCRCLGGSSRSSGCSCRACPTR